MQLVFYKSFLQELVEPLLALGESLVAVVELSLFWRWKLFQVLTVPLALLG
jgi:hypothetical protein